MLPLMDLNVHIGASGDCGIASRGALGDADYFVFDYIIKKDGADRWVEIIDRETPGNVGGRRVRDEIAAKILAAHAERGV